MRAAQLKSVLPRELLASVVVGTAVGLVVKYLLDKHYIFRFHTRNLAHDSRTFALYTAMGLAAADVAATLAPDYVGALAKPLGLVRRRILSPEVMRYVCLYSPARRATSPAAEGFADHLIRILAQRK